MPTTTHPAGLHYLAAPGIHVTTATTIAGPCERCDQAPAALRVYGDPHPDTLHPVECEQVCGECGPWVVTLALGQQAPWSTRPIHVEIQGA